MESINLSIEKIENGFLVNFSSNVTDPDTSVVSSVNVRKFAADVKEVGAIVSELLS